MADVRNVVRVKGEPERVEGLRTLMQNPRFPHEDFCFDQLIPMPEELRNTDETAIEMEDGRHVRVVTKITLDARYGEIVTVYGPKKVAELEAEYGADWCYDWQMENWGTKWGACDCTVIPINDEELVYEFETAWFAPEKVCTALRERFPDLEITWTCSDALFPEETYSL